MWTRRTDNIREAIGEVLGVAKGNFRGPKWSDGGMERSRGKWNPIRLLT